MLPPVDAVRRAPDVVDDFRCVTAEQPHPIIEDQFAAGVSWDPWAGFGDSFPCRCRIGTKNSDLVDRRCLARCGDLNGNDVPADAHFNAMRRPPALGGLAVYSEGVAFRLGFGSDLNRLGILSYIDTVDISVRPEVVRYPAGSDRKRFQDRGRFRINQFEMIYLWMRCPEHGALTITVHQHHSRITQ